MSQITQRGHGGPLALVANGAFQTSTDASLQTLLGSRWDLSDGREVALGQPSSATTVAPGYFYQNAALIANHQGLTVTAVQAYSANGNTPATVTVTLGGTAATAGQYAGGFLVVQSSTGIGQTLKIANNPAQATTNGALVVTLEETPTTALTTSSVVNLIPAAGYNVVISPAAASLTNTEFGVGLYPIPASSYGFFVTHGNTAVVAVSAGVAAGSSLSVGAAGAGVILSAGLPVLGHVGAALASSSANIAYVEL